MKIFLGFCIVLFSFACGPSRDHNEYKNVDPAKTRKDFYQESELCEREKDKHSAKIQGREFGFEGYDTGYLGCMKLKGWDKIAK